MQGGWIVPSDVPPRLGTAQWYGRAPLYSGAEAVDWRWIGTVWIKRNQDARYSRLDQ